MRRAGRRYAVLLAVALVVAVSPTAAAWTVTAGNPGNSFGTAASFPTYPAAVLRDNPWAYHRSDDAATAAAGSAAADSSGNARPGIYHLASTGPSTVWTFDSGPPTAADPSGAANPGTYGAATVALPGYAGNAASMAGDASGDGYVSGAAPAIDTSAAFTVSAWVYATDFSISRVALSQSGSIGSAVILKYNHYGNQWEFGLSQAESYGPTHDSTYSAGGVPALNTWVHLTGVHDPGAAGQQVKFYVNGAAQTPAAHTSVWNATGPLQVGRVKEFGGWQTNSSVSSGPWAGRVDEVRTYRRALSPAEVTALYTAPTDPGLTAGVPGALTGSQAASTAVAFGGAGNAYNTTQIAAPGPAAFTVECWFKASGTGGQLVAFTSDTSGLASGSKDRMVYLDAAGRLTFGTYYSGATHTVRSPAAYHDGAWHHLAASLGTAGLKLHVDGSLVASDASITTAEAFAGYWRWGGGDTSSWPDRPDNDYFTGTLDELAVYLTQLSDQQVRLHYHANH